MQIVSGKIITNFGGIIAVKTQDNKILNCTMRSQFKGELTVGDNVKVEIQDNMSPVIIELLDRKNLISRPNQYQRKNKNIAANIDQAVILITHNPEPVEHYIDRYLAALENSDIQPIIAINKVDSQNKVDATKMNEISLRYEKIGYPVYSFSALSSIGIQEFVESALSGKTSIFIGQSGVGKSETLNTILGEKIIKTNQISLSNNKGKHTTTCSVFYEINDITNIIDSPGIREFGLWNITKQDLFNGFIDFKKYIGQCKFRNCAHEEKSLGCEIVKRVNSGEIDILRFKNYHRIMKEII